MMHRVVWLTVAVLAFIPALHAQDLMDWLQDAPPSSAEPTVDSITTGSADLLTLEPGESEMYPRISPDGRRLLVVSGKSRKQVVTQRLVENGDPLNLVSEYDPQVLDSIAWFGNDTVTFLSYRADSLGLWKKPVNGGVIRRYKRLDGEIRSPIVLGEGNVIAVRMRLASKRAMAAGHKRMGVDFDNWQVRGKQSNLVRISENGAEQELASGTNPALSPDGKRLVFTMQEDRYWHLFMMNVDGTGLIQLTEGHNIDVQPTWSPDGKWIAFTSNRAKQRALNHPDKDRQSGRVNWDIWLIGHDGRGLTRLTRDNARDGAPAIAGNGRVYFHSDRNISKDDIRLHQVRGRVKGFHIWSVALPAKVS